MWILANHCQVFRTTGWCYGVIKCCTICRMVKGVFFSFCFFPPVLISVLTVGIFLPLAQLICSSGGLLTRRKKNRKEESSSGWMQTIRAVMFHVSLCSHSSPLYTPTHTHIQMSAHLKPRFKKGAWLCGSRAVKYWSHCRPPGMQLSGIQNWWEINQLKWSGLAHGEERAVLSLPEARLDNYSSLS